MKNPTKTTVEIADASGHSSLQLTKEETMEKVAAQPNAWIFAGDRLLQPEELEQAEWADIGTVRLVPGLVGGL